MTTATIRSFVRGEWVAGADAGVTLHHAVNGQPIGHASSAGIDFAEMVRHARAVGGPALRKLTFHQRASLLKRMAQHLMERKEKFYAISA